MRLLEFSANASDGYGLLCLGLMYERGDVDVEKNEDHAKELYERCEKVGFPDVEWIVGAMGEKKKLKPGNEEWDRLLYRMRFNSIPRSELNLSSLRNRSPFSLRKTCTEFKTKVVKMK